MKVHDRSPLFKQLEMVYAVIQSRRRFIKSALMAGAVANLAALRTLGSQASKSTAESKPLFEGFAIQPRRGVQEATLTRLKDDRYFLIFAEKKGGPGRHSLVGKYSADHGRTWGETVVLHTTDGSEIPTERDNPHASLVRLRSGALGLIYCGPAARPGRDGTLQFRTSQDEGKTWSAPVMIDAWSALCRSSCTRVLSTGRIVIPTFIWFSSMAGGESESEENSFCFSWIYYSDDEGKTWRKSLSEPFVSTNNGRNGAYSFEEPTLEELTDGRLLMFGRTELGCPYQTISKDGGITWSEPRPVRLAASYAPALLIRIPSTRDLLLVWNQSSTEEILNGLSRHRLSTAISQDEGMTWTHFRNLESLDDRSRIPPPPLAPEVYRMVDYGYRQPLDRERYPRAPGCLRICYPTAVFWENEVAFTYDYGYGGSGELKTGSGTKIKILSLDWLYGK